MGQKHLTRFGVQIVGTLGFILSLWAARKIAPRLALRCGCYCIPLCALIFQKRDLYESQKIVWLIEFAFPNVKFYSPGRKASQVDASSSRGRGLAITLNCWVVRIFFSSKVSGYA
jgi:hypothetical protein